jgi:N6-L-threonylcarbamoyladenine synthase
MRAEEHGYDFSFSGLKTAVVNYVQRQSVARLETSKVAQPSDYLQMKDLVASFQQAVVDTLVDKTLKAAKDYKVKTVALAGGVSANSLLRKELQAQGQKQGLDIHIPQAALCTDNAAMIGCAAYYKLQRNELADFALSPLANLKLAP